MAGRARCAIVGLGRIGSTLEQDRLREKPASHAGAVAASPDCLLSAGCDLRPERREAFARRWGCGSVYEDARLMLERHEPQILHVATPPESHLELVRLAAGRVPVVICEKPLARSSLEAREIVDVCRQAGTALLVNHERRYSRDYRLARQRIATGRFGELVTVTGRLHMGRGHPPADILWDDGTHLLDALRFLTGGELEALCAREEDAGSPGAVLQVLLRAGGVPAALEVSGRLEALVFELDLCSTRGRLRVGNGLYEEWESGPSPHYEGFRSLRRLRTRPPRRTGYFRGLLADAVAVLRQPGRRPVSSGEDGLAAVEAIENILGLL